MLVRHFGRDFAKLSNVEVDSMVLEPTAPAEANICGMSEPPIFKVREGNPGWMVDVTWGWRNGRNQRICQRKGCHHWGAKVYEILAKEK